MSQLLKGSIFDPLDPNLPQDEKVKFLVSDTYCRILTDFARGITGNTKVQTVILPPMSSALGYTDGNTFYVCTVHETFADQLISDITQFILAIAAHEPWHGKYTNFAYWQHRIRSIANGQGLYKWLFNALCDARIERIGCLEFPGVKAFVIKFREFLFERADDDASMNEAQKLLNNILFFATCGKVKYAMSDTMQKTFDKCRPLIISARRADTTEDCDKFVSQIFDIVYPLVKSEPNMPKNITGEMTAKQNHKDFKGNPNTGGADSIVFDEDMDEESGNDSNQSSNSSEKSSQKSSAKSSEETSDDDTSSCNGTGNTDNDSDGDNSNNCTSDSTSNNEGDETSTDKDAIVSSNEDTGDATSTSDNNDGDGADGADADKDMSQNGKNSDKGNDTLSDLEKETANEMIRNALSSAASAFANEQTQKNADSQTMRNLERDSSYGTRVKCAKPNPQNAPLYSEVVANAAPIISHLITTMKRVINYNQDEVVRRTSTGFLDTQSLPYTHRGTCFAQRHEKSDESELFISFVLDCSGSMGGQRNINTLIATAIILEACNALKIPVSIKGFASGYSSCDITHFWDYKYRNKACRHNLAQLYASGGTPLAEALKYEREYLSKVKRADKICFVLTDGAPNCTASAIMEYNKLRKDALVYGVAIGDDLPCLTGIFGKDRIIDARDLKSLPQQLGKIIRCNLIK